MDIKKVLDDFLPDKIFDAHMHLYSKSIVGDMCLFLLPDTAFIEDYYCDMSEIFGERKIAANIISYPVKRIATEREKNLLRQSDEFLYKELAKSSENVGEILVLPDETEEHIESRIKGSKICGFKCYHTLNAAERTFGLDIRDFLPESAWRVADKRKMVITLHLVKDKSLSDENNLNYILTMSERYPNATLILAHAARSFASWTGFESVEKLKHAENVWFDLAAVCESPAIFQIFKKCGTNRVMWGSDYPISDFKGKAISLADKFFWIYEKEQPEIAKAVEMFTVAEENLLAVRQAAIMADLSAKDIEDIFYNNAKRLFSDK